MKKVKVKNFQIGPMEKLAVMCGPCVIESEDMVMHIAESLKKMFEKRSMNLIFKSSYDKANRASFHSFRGPGYVEGCRILERVQKEFDLPVVTDVHTVEEAQYVGKRMECLQIPAFMCRQTDLVVAAAQTGAVINVKKGQFMAPHDMSNVVKKIHSANNENVILVERGVTFGYNNLVVDMRSIPMMQSLGVPVCFDATHAVQFPGGRGDSSGGDRQYVPTLSKAAIAAGANCIFIETHPDPDNAKSDSASMMHIKDLPKLLDTLEKLYEIVQTHAI